MLISTINIIIWEQQIQNNTKMSSLDPFSLHKYLNLWKVEWCKYCVLETTSHWLEQYRFNDIEFDIWVLTNITPEHLDYHITFENYVKAKKKLFTSIITNSKNFKWVVLPKDLDIWRKWLEELPFENEIDYWILTNASLKSGNIQELEDKTLFDIFYLWKKYWVKLNLLWEHNVYNSLWAIWVWILLWVKIEKIIQSLEKFWWLPWRLEKYERDWVIYFIDFAHTPNALDKTLSYLRKIKKNWSRIITLFWAPWNRDPFKRKPMWEIVSRLSDIVIVSDDDPDTENRYKIINQICSWIKRNVWDDFFIIPERFLAINFILNIVKPWDIVLMAWKWHENIQVTNFWKIEWNDKLKLIEAYELKEKSNNIDLDLFKN